MKVNKLYRKTHIRPIPDIWTWGHVMKRARHRYNRKYFETYDESDDLWTLNIKANKIRIHTVHLRSEWVQCIFQNLEKFRYQFYEHSKQNPEGVYKHGEFL